MISYEQRQGQEDQPTTSADDHIAPAPRVSVQAFCETVETAAAVQSAGEDRRLDKAHLKIQMGGMAAMAGGARARKRGRAPGDQITPRTASPAASAASPAALTRS